MKLLTTTAFVLTVALSGTAHAEFYCKFNGGTPLAEIDIPRVSVKAEDVPIAYEPGFTDADLKFAWGEQIAFHKNISFGAVDDTGRGLLFTKEGPALGATNADGKPVWRFAPQGSACEQVIISRDVTGAGPSGYSFGGTAAQGDVNYTLWSKKTGTRFETILIAMAGKKGTKLALTRIATLPVEAKAISVHPNAQNGTVDLIMVAAKPRDKDAYLIALNYKPKP